MKNLLLIGLAMIVHLNMQAMQIAEWDNISSRIFGLKTVHNEDQFKDWERRLALMEVNDLPVHELADVPVLLEHLDCSQFVISISTQKKLQELIMRRFEFWDEVDDNARDIANIIRFSLIFELSFSDADKCKILTLADWRLHYHVGVNSVAEIFFFCAHHKLALTNNLIEFLKNYIDDIINDKFFIKNQSSHSAFFKLKKVLTHYENRLPVNFYKNFSSWIDSSSDNIAVNKAADSSSLKRKFSETNLEDIQYEETNFPHKKIRRK